MKVLIIAVNKEKHPYPVVPLGVAYIIQSLKKNGYTSDFLDLNFVDNNEEALSRKISSFDPDIMGLSIRNIDNTSYPGTNYYLPKIKKIVDIIKQLSDVEIVVGGSGFSVLPVETLKFLNLTYGIIGEGENSFNELINALSFNKSTDHVSGLVKNDRNKIKVNSRTINHQYFENNFASREHIDINKYYSHGSIINIQTKRGCAFNCNYCTYPLIEGSKIWKRDPRQIVEEIKYFIQTYGIDYFYFIDSVFNYPIDHALEICQEIIKQNLNINWTAFFNPRYFTKELVKYLIKAGCTGIELGVDSMSDSMLKNLNKNFNLEHIFHANDLLLEHGIKQCYYLLIGGPGETNKTIKENFDNVIKVKPKAVIVQCGIRIYPNSGLFTIAEKEGYDLSDLLAPQFYISRETADSIVEQTKNYCTKLPNFIFEGMDNKLSIDVLKQLRDAGIKCPLWELKK